MTATLVFLSIGRVESMSQDKGQHRLEDLAAPGGYNMF